MRIVVFGASGGTGREIVEQALIRGDDVTAFVRDASALEPASRLRVVVGDVLNAEVVREAIVGQNGVLSALGSRPHEGHDVLERGLANIIAAMSETGVRRIVIISTAGAANLDEALTHQSLAGKIVLRTMASTVLRGPIADGLAQERLLEASDLEYTIVRPPRLTDERRTGRYRVDEEGLPPGAVSISRGDVAEFMLMQLDSDKYIRKAPYIGM